MSESKTINLLLVERLSLLRASLKALLAQEESLQIVGESGEFKEVVPLMEKLHPDIILFHLHPGDEDMVSTIAAITANDEHPPILLLTADQPESPINRSGLHAGAAGLIEMKEPPETLFKAIRCVNAGELWIDRRTTALVLQDLRNQRNHPDARSNHPKDMLSPREKEVVALVATGLSTEGIAEKLFISEKTVRNHLVSIYAKLDVSNRIQLALCASKLGLS
jgi:DNA-binding NarL/FixJ family response regulator